MKKVKIYTTSDSAPCDELRKYLNSKSIDFTENNIGSGQAAAALIKKTGYSVVPQIEIDGQIIVGFDRKKIDELLNN